MAVSHVLTHTFAQDLTNGTTITIQPSGTVPVGDLLVLAILTQANRTITSVTDTQGNTWTEHLDTVNGTIETLGLWTLPVSAQLTTSDTITVTFGSSTTASTVLLEQFTGTPTGTWVDVGIVSASGTSTSPSVTAGSATAHADDMLFGVIAYDGAASAFTPSASPLSFTELEDVNQVKSTVNRNIATFWDLPGSTVTATYEGTLSSSRNWIIAGLAFLADAPPATEYPEDLSVSTTATASLSAQNFEHAETILASSSATATLSAENFQHAETILVSVAATASLPNESVVLSYSETQRVDLSATVSLVSEILDSVETLTLAANAPPSLASELRIDVERLDASAAATVSLSSQAFEAVETLQVSASATVTLPAEVFGAEIIDGPLNAAANATLSLTTETFTQSDVETLTVAAAATLSLTTETFSQGSTVIETLSLTATATPILSSIKRISTLTTPRININRGNTAHDTKYVSYLDIPEACDLLYLYVKMDGKGTGGAALTPTQEFRGICYDSRDSLNSVSGEPDNRIAISMDPVTVNLNETDIEREFRFAPQALNAARYWFGVHAGEYTNVARINQESQSVTGRWTRSDPYADGTNINFDATTATSSNRMYVSVVFEVDETHVYADGEATILPLNVGSRQTTPVAPLTAGATGGGSLLGELIESVDDLTLTATASPSLSSEVGTYVDDLTASATATLSLTTDTVTGGSGLYFDTLTLAPSAALQLVTEETDTLFGSNENGGAQVLALRKDTTYGGAFLATRDGRVEELELWVDGLGTAATGTAQLRGLIYSYQAGVGPTAIRARGAVTVNVNRGDAAARIALPITPLDVVAGTTYVLAVQVGGTDNVARISGSSLTAGTYYGTDTYADGPDSTFPVTTTTTSGSGSIEIFGYADGNMVGASDADQYLNAIQALGCQAVRTDLTWASNATNFNQTDCDGFAVKCANRGLEWIPCIHPKHPTASDYALPANIVTNGTAVIDKFQARYGRGGTFITAYNAEKAKATPGAIGGVTVSKTGTAKPIRRYEIWNEPQTGTGDCTPSGPSLQTNATAAASFVAFFKAAAASIKAHPTFDPTQDKVCGPALGGIDIDYANVMYSIDNDCFLDVDIITAHCYMSQNPNTSPGNTTAPLKTGLPTSISQYNASGGQKYSDPEQKRIRTFKTLKDWANSHPKTAHLEVGMTEGGYSGSNQSPVPPNVVTEANQATWTGNVIDWAQTQSYFVLWCPYNPIDHNSVTYTGNGTQYQYSYWYENLGVRTTTAMKPAGTTYAAKIAAGGGGTTTTTEITTQNVKLPIRAVVTTTDIGGATITDTLTAEGTATPSLSAETFSGTTSFTDDLTVAASATVSLSAEEATGTTTFPEDATVAVAATVSLSSEVMDWGDLVSLTATGTPILASEEGDQLEDLALTLTASLSLANEATSTTDLLELSATAVPSIASEATQVPVAPDVEVFVDCYNETVIVPCETGEFVVPFTVDERIVEF